MPWWLWLIVAACAMPAAGMLWEWWASYRYRRAQTEAAERALETWRRERRRMRVME